MTFTKRFDIKFSERRDKDPSFSALIDLIQSNNPMLFGLFINLFNAFGAAGGLNALADLVSADRLSARLLAPGSISSSGTSLAGFKLPLDVIAMLLSPLQKIKGIASDQVVQELMAAGKATFFQRLEGLDDKDLKELSRDSVARSLDMMASFLRLGHSEDQVAQLIETHELGFALKCVQCPILEKRLHGLSEIKRVIERVHGGLAMRDVRRNGLTEKELVEWILRNNLLGLLLNENAHSEVVKRASHILLFLAQQSAMTNEHIELLWRCQQDKHEDIIRVVYDTIRDLIPHLTLDVSCGQHV